jgi:Family of unknown function (DUF6152)
MIESSSIDTQTGTNAMKIHTAIRAVGPLLGFTLVLGVGPVLAHHSAAMFEPEKVVTVEGTVKQFEYTNPHSWLYVLVRDNQGAETLWGFEAEGPSALMRAGIKANALQPGDKVTVKARPLRDGRPAGAWVTVTKQDGTVLNPRPSAVPVSAPAN